MLPKCAFIKRSPGPEYMTSTTNSTDKTCPCALLWNLTKMSHQNEFRWKGSHRYCMLIGITQTASYESCRRWTRENTKPALFPYVGVALVCICVKQYKMCESEQVCMLFVSMFLTSVWRHGHSLAEGGTGPVFVWRQVPLPVALIPLLLENDKTYGVKQWK